MQILNLTQHTTTPEQIEAGVVDVAPEHKAKLQSLLNFTPKRSDMVWRANAIAEIAMSYNCQKALIGGAPWHMNELAQALVLCPDNIQPVFTLVQPVSE